MTARGARSSSGLGFRKSPQHSLASSMTLIEAALRTSYIRTPGPFHSASALSTRTSPAALRRHKLSVRRLSHNCNSRTQFTTLGGFAALWRFPHSTFSLHEGAVGAYLGGV